MEQSSRGKLEDVRNHERRVDTGIRGERDGVYVSDSWQS